MADWLLCYDIKDPRRLQRVHRALQAFALPLQHSVFLYTGDHRTLERYLKHVVSLIQPVDDFRQYPLPKRGVRERLGRSVLPTGITWGALPAGETENLLYDPVCSSSYMA